MHSLSLCWSMESFELPFSFLFKEWQLVGYSAGNPLPYLESGSSLVEFEPCSVGSDGTLSS